MLTAALTIQFLLNTQLHYQGHGSHGVPGWRKHRFELCYLYIYFYYGVSPIRLNTACTFLFLTLLVGHREAVTPVTLHSNGLDKIHISSCSLFLLSQTQTE